MSHRGKAAQTQSIQETLDSMLDIIRKMQMEQRQTLQHYMATLEQHFIMREELRMQLAAALETNKRLQTQLEEKEQCLQNLEKDNFFPPHDHQYLQQQTMPVSYREPKPEGFQLGTGPDYFIVDKDPNVKPGTIIMKSGNEKVVMENIGPGPGKETD